MGRIPVVIPARSGSKGIPHKNIIDFCGKPLLAWSILQSVRCHTVSNVYISTDGEEIAHIAKEYGAKVIYRPPEISSDTSSSEEALEHAIGEMEKEEEFDSVIFLQATSPLRRWYDVEAAIQEYRNGGYDSLFSMATLEDYCLWRKEEHGLQSFSYDYRNRGRRQDREPLFLENGSIYIFSKEIFRQCHNRLGGKIGMYAMPFEYSYEIDSAEDIPVCEYFMKKLLEEEKEQ